MGTLQLLILPMLLESAFIDSATSVGYACQPEPSRQSEAPSVVKSRSVPSVPSWAADARWYHVVVPRFHNADPAKGPIEGNLAGLADRLGYLKELGINALLLDALFHDPSTGKHPASDLRHIDDRLGQKGSLSRVSGETADPGTWRFSKSDQLFGSFVKTAHDQGFRVAVAVDVERVARSLAKPDDLSNYWLAATKRWLDPNADGNPSDGVDGWVVAGVERAPSELWRRWRTQVKKLNRNALLVVDVHKNVRPWLGEGGFDVGINYETGETIRRFFASTPSAYPVSKFVDDLVIAAKGHTLGTRNAWLTPIGGPGMVRLRTLLTKNHKQSKKSATATVGADEDPVLAPLRLATFLAQFSQGAPVTYYGDEVGMSARPDASEPEPMWWPDLRQGATGVDAGYYARLASLIRWVGVRRDMDEPLRRGTFEKVMVDEARRLFAVSRTIENQRMILLMNLSDTKQRVMLKVGKPLQTPALLSPHLVPVWHRADKIPSTQTKAQVAPITMLASQQHPNEAGEVRLWVDPMLVRLVFIDDTKPK